MYKTIWIVTNETEHSTIKLTYYHFRKEYAFPSWYMEPEKEYNVEMIFNLKLCRTLSIFLKCLFHEYVVTTQD